MDTHPTRPELTGTHGMVATTHWLATAAGTAMFESGGNAIDAAVAAGFALQVVEPHMGGPGGEVPILFQAAAASGEVRTICGQGVAPAAASIGRFRELGLSHIPGTGLLAACVPGAFDAWMLLLRDYGTLRLRDVLKHAIEYADAGFPASREIVDAIQSMESLFREEWHGSAAVYLPAPRVGARLRNRSLAATYRRMVKEAEIRATGRDEQIEAARDLFYRGFVAEAVGEFAAGTQAMDSSGARHAGLLTSDDMAAWSATLEAPLTIDYRGWTIYKTDTWGQGLVFLQQLALLAGFDLDRSDRTGLDFVHTVIECAKLAFADREAWYGDPAHFDVPTSTLCSEAYAAERRRLVGEDASHALRPGSPDGREPVLSAGVGEGQTAVAGVGEPTRALREASPLRGDTSQLATADRFGNVVAATPSGGWLQSSPVIPALGFCLGTRAQTFWLEEGLATSLTPGARPRSTLTPSVALRDTGAALAFGTPGGDQQDQWSLIFFLTHAHAGFNLQESIDAPTFHTTHFPSSFFPREAHPGQIELESRFPRATVQGLLRRGHGVEIAEPWSLSRLAAVGREADGIIKAAADARGRRCYAAGR
jgi:gamma-glutamyltranspeptidase / glutathione hydrolase